MIAGFKRCVALLPFAAVWLAGGPLHAQSTAFTYQGRLARNGLAAAGLYDFRFGLFATHAEVPAIITTTNYGLPVSNGVFTAIVDFGEAFDGTARWLEIGVRPGGDTNDFAALTPRQAITTAPYALLALNSKSVSGVLSATNLPTNVALLDGDNHFTGALTVSSLVVTNLHVSGMRYTPDIASITEEFPAYPPYTNLTWKFMNFAGVNPFTVLRAAFTNGYGPYCTPVPPAGTFCTTPIWFEFGTDADSFVFSVSGSGEYWGLSVDGIDNDSRTRVPVDGVAHYYKVNFPSRRWRQVTIKQSNGGGFYGCWIAPTNGWLEGASHLRRRMVVLGDSFTEEPTSQGYPSRLMQLFKNLDVWASGVGGTGYINLGSSGRTNFQGRVMADVVANHPDYVVVAGGINDISYPSNDVFQAAVNLFGTLKTNLPDAKIIVVGPWWPRRANPLGDPNLFATNLALSNACVEAGISNFVDTISDSWITGVYNLPGSGNAVNYTSADGTHPTAAGHWHLAYRLARAIGPRLPELAPVNWTP